MSNSREQQRLRLSESLSSAELRILCHLGLEKRFPKLYAGYVRKLNTIEVSCERQFEANLGTARSKVSHESNTLQYAVHEAVVQAVLQRYP